MGTYDTTRLPIYQYLHQPGHPKYAIADNFFQAAFGGSFLNHQWLIAAASPVLQTRRTAARRDATHSVLDAQRHARCDLRRSYEPPPGWARSTRRRTAAWSTAC